MSDEIKKVAVLVDAENISYKYAQLILDEARNIGNVVCRRIYGDWSDNSILSWKTPIMDYSINPIQQFHSVSGKNSSDSALIIDAMDLLHEGRYQCICIVSSDSDFTRLASRLRESEIYVVGMGEQKTPSAFRGACDKFLYLDVISSQNEAIEEAQIEEEQSKETVVTNDVFDEIEEDDSKNGLNQKIIIASIDEIIDAESDEDGWVGLAAVGEKLGRKITDFDVRNFGFAKLKPFIEHLRVYDIRIEELSSKPDSKVVYIKRKEVTE